ncbi:MAG: DegT/DnrJ/EryC1/StrS family aminotransferase [Magnetococcales bacterium]|nr:DegT/DnrJ/EryC1/StrS family aminotransferase [Magnetococcales bacterium]
MSRDRIIPVNVPSLDGREAEYLLQCLETGWISSEGPFVGEFENAFARMVGRRFGIAVANGTAALEVGVQALKLEPGDEVILPTFTIISCAGAVVRAGGIPVVVDCDPLTWNMDVEQIESVITPRTRVIMVVHIYGLPVDMDPLLEIARKHGLTVIEDAAEAHGLTYKGRSCGSFGALSTFSFYPNKLVTTGEGGMIVTDDEHLAEQCRSIRNLCFQPEARFIHEELGFNYRMTNLQAAIGLAQLERMEHSIHKKRTIGEAYKRWLSGLSAFEMPLAKTPFADNIYWVYGLVLTDRALTSSAKEAIGLLNQHGVGTRPFFWPMHEQPVFKRMGFFRGVTLPVSERLARRGFYVPSGLGMKMEDVRQCCRIIWQIFGDGNMPEELRSR